MEDDSAFIRGIFFTLLFLAVLAVGAVLKVMAEVTLPIAIAVLLALVFHPIVETLHSKFKVPPIIGISIIFLFVFVIMFFLGGLLYSSAKTILSLYPKYEERLLTIYLGIADIFNFSYDEELSLISNTLFHSKICLFPVQYFAGFYKKSHRGSSLCHFFVHRNGSFQSKGYGCIGR